LAEEVDALRERLAASSAIAGLVERAGADRRAGDGSSSPRGTGTVMRRAHAAARRGGASAIVAASAAADAATAAVEVARANRLADEAQMWRKRALSLEEELRRSQTARNELLDRFADERREWRREVRTLKLYAARPRGMAARRPHRDRACNTRRRRNARSQTASAPEPEWVDLRPAFRSSTASRAEWEAERDAVKDDPSSSSDDDGWDPVVDKLAQHGANRSFGRASPPTRRGMSRSLLRAKTMSHVQRLRETQRELRKRLRGR
jgi:hypothetical protein